MRATMTRDLLILSKIIYDFFLILFLELQQIEFESERQRGVYNRDSLTSRSPNWLEQVLIIKYDQI